MKYCSGYCGVIRCTTGISMVPKAKTTLSQRQKACDIAAHASQRCANNNCRKGVRKRSNKKREIHHESLQHVLPPTSLNFISPVDLTGYTIFADGGAIDNPPINMFNLPSGDKNLSVREFNNGDLHAPNIHLKDATKGLTQIQRGGGGCLP